MAQKTVVHLIDDVDGSKATQTIQFALDGATYEIDLSDDNAGKLREALSSWIGAGRRVGGRAKRPGTNSSGRPSRESGESGESGENAAIRQWARENNMDVSERGRIPAEVRAAYTQAH